MVKDDKFATFEHLKETEKRFQLLVDSMKTEMSTKHQTVEELLITISKKIDPIVEMYKNAGTFGKWIKGALIFLSILFGFFLTFKQFLVQVIKLYL